MSNGTTGGNFLSSIDPHTKWIGRLDRAAAWVMIVVGFAAVAIAPAVPSGLALIIGLTLVVGGWRLQRMAESKYRAVSDGAVLARTELVRQIGADVISVPPNVSVSTLVNDYILSSAERACPVIDHDRLVGVVPLNRVRDLPLDRWDQTEVGEIMISVSQIAEARSMA